jgi:hypothetical protein
VTAALPWVPEKRDGVDGLRCLREGAKHGWFVPPQECPGCTLNPIIVIDDTIDEPLPPPPEGCMSTEAIEVWFVAIALAAEKSANAIDARRQPRPPKKKPRKGAPAPKLRVLDFHDEGAIAKHRDNAIKAMRAANELASRREDETIVKRREKRIAERQRGASH